MPNSLVLLCFIQHAWMLNFYNLGLRFYVQAMALSLGLGDAANVAQLTGLDAVSLIRMIVKAASTARSHKKNCQKFALQLKLIGNLLEQIRISELKKHPSTREPLELLEDALRRSYILVHSCHSCNYLYLLVMGWKLIKQFRTAQSEIAEYLNLIPLITLVDIQRSRVWFFCFSYFLKFSKFYSLKVW